MMSVKRAAKARAMDAARRAAETTGAMLELEAPTEYAELLEAEAAYQTAAKAFFAAAPDKEEAMEAAAWAAGAPIPDEWRAATEKV